MNVALPPAKGEKIGSGTEHGVFTITGRPDEVLKVPQINRSVAKILGDYRVFGATAETLRSDLEMAQTYFGESILPSKIYGSGLDYHIIQKKLPEGCHELTQGDLKNPIIRENFGKLLEKNDMLIQGQGVSLELLGRAGAVGAMLGGPKISNIFVTKEGELILHDFTLMHITKNRYHKFWYELWRGLIQEHFGYDTSPQ